MRTSYRKDDVILLLKDVTGLVEPQPTEERERLIQAGRHYCEMLPLEYTPPNRRISATVSALYTSVDVYKRQSLSWSIPALKTGRACSPSRM